MLTRQRPLAGRVSVTSWRRFGALAVVALVVATTACTPEQVHQAAANLGVTLTEPQAQAVADHHNKPTATLTAFSTSAPVNPAAITPEMAGAIAWTAAVVEQQKAAAAFGGGSIEQMIRTQWAGTGQADRAVRIARCESGLRADPPHNNPHYGVFQMGRSEFRKFGSGNIFNAADNIRSAYRYWDYGDGTYGNLKGSWRPWACRG